MTIHELRPQPPSISTNQINRRQGGNSSKIITVHGHIALEGLDAILLGKDRAHVSHGKQAPLFQYYYR